MYLFLFQLKEIKHCFSWIDQHSLQVKLTVIEHEKIMQIKVIYVSVQLLHNDTTQKCWIDGLDKPKIRDQLH